MYESIKMGIFDKLFIKKGKDSEIKDVGIEKGEVKKKRKQITTKKSTKKKSTDEITDALKRREEELKKSITREKPQKQKETKTLKSKFAPWTSGGVCDVCNEPLRTGAAFKIPVNVFYSSPKYREWFNRNQMPILRTMYGVPSDITVDIVLANMRRDDPTEYSAVCNKCVELFEEVVKRDDKWDDDPRERRDDGKIYCPYYKARIFETACEVTRNNKKCNRECGFRD